MRVAPLLTFTLAIFLASLPAASISADPETNEDKPVIVRPSELQWSNSPALPAGVTISIRHRVSEAGSGVNGKVRGLHADRKAQA